MFIRDIVVLINNIIIKLFGVQKFTEANIRTTDEIPIISLRITFSCANPATANSYTQGIYFIPTIVAKLNSLCINTNTSLLESYNNKESKGSENGH